MTASKRWMEVFAERDEWQRLMSLESEQQLEVYIDLKSPHAYLAVRPSLEVARDYKVRVNFLPYTLSYTGFGLTTSVEPDMQRRPPSAAADRKARMYYATARQYAALQRLPFRTPHRLLDSDLAHKVLLFAKQQNLEVPFLMHVYLCGWGSGWREYELESLPQLRDSLLQVGAEVDDLETFVAPGGAGELALASCMENADATGYAGVPHYVFFDLTTEAKLGLFGREHLALIRANYARAGLARNSNVRSEFSHAWTGPSKTSPRE